MRLLFDGRRLLFADRALPSASNLTLLFPFDGTLLVGGHHRIATEKQALSLPLHLLCEGKNHLLFRKDGQVLPVEGLVREGNALRPTGFPLEETALALLTRIGDLEAQLSVLKEKEAKRADAPSLFS